MPDAEPFTMILSMHINIQEKYKIFISEFLVFSAVSEGIGPENSISEFRIMFHVYI